MTASVIAISLVTALQWGSLSPRGIRMNSLEIATARSALMLMSVPGCSALTSTKQQSREREESLNVPRANQGKA